MAKDETQGAAAAATTPTLAGRLQTLSARSQNVWMQSLDRAIDDITTLRPDPLNTAPAMARLAFGYMDHPQRAVEAGMKFWSAQADLWLRSWQRVLGGEGEPAAAPARGDKRFKHEAWAENPVLDYLKQSYLLTAGWLKDQVANADDLS
ncbi:MAG: hypothetical protein AAGE83_17430, partial [Pseudomonadota bacterium]